MHKGVDVHKQVKGRKRHIAVDTLGLLIAVVVHCAGLQDRDAAKRVCEKIGTQSSGCVKSSRAAFPACNETKFRF